MGTLIFILVFISLLAVAGGVTLAEYFGDFDNE